MNGRTHDIDGNLGNAPLVSGPQCGFSLTPFPSKSRLKPENDKRIQYISGILFGVLMKDCCDCDAVKCIKCEPPETREESCPRGPGARPENCYTYEEKAYYAEEAHSCWRSRCIVNCSDAPVDEVETPRQLKFCTVTGDQYSFSFFRCAVASL